MEISNRLKQRFCKDMNISIQLFNFPFFENRIELMGYRNDYNEFVHFVTSTFADEEEYFAYYSELKDKIIDYIKSSETYNTLQNDTSFCKKPSLNIKQGDTYKDSCIGRQFLSIDMSKANFSALVKYGKETGTWFFNDYSYEKFIKQFTPYEYFAKSKYIRQVVFGNCNPKRQIAYETFLMTKVMTNIVENSAKTGLSMDDVYSLNSDEVIFDITGKNTEEICKNIAELFNNIPEFDFPLKVESFKVGKLEGTKAYIKLFDNGKYELKCVSPYEAPFIYRYMQGRPSDEIDNYFLFEGQLAKFESAPIIKLIAEKKENLNLEENYEEDYEK